MDRGALCALGIFSLLNYEISLTVIAALLTLVGYSMNDTIVIFDRVRENLRLMRREPLSVIVNRSINKTLSGTSRTPPSPNGGLQPVRVFGVRLALDAPLVSHPATARDDQDWG